MKIDANMITRAVNGLPPPARAAAGAEPAAESDSFASSTALQMALKNTSDTRPEAVARGLNLIRSGNYPSADAVKQLSGFLASQLQSDPE
ncbi:MAG: hypothetical protein ABSA83_23430 [Verrucomicrobiota bacterium]|jgi:hypothetical protein